MLVGMEMEFRDDTRRRKVLVILGLMFAVAAAGAAFLLISQAQSGGTKVVTREVVVAAHDISERSIIQSGDVTLRALPDDPSLTSALTKPEDAVGRIAGVTIFAQQPITPNLLTSSEAGSGFSILAPEETIAPDSPFWRAVSVDVPDDRAVGGVILIGQRVDLFVTVDIEIQKLDGNAAPTPVPTPNPSGPFGPFGPYYTNPSTKITYQDLPVLVHSGTLYVVKATVAQAEEISHFEAAGSASFSLALRPEGDKRPVPTASMGVTTNIIVWRYGYPIPRILLLP
jgi:Flp pilus assembly protein CpaB